MNRWIVSKYFFVQHTSLVHAKAEKERLEELTGKKFRLYRVKSTIEPDEGEELHGEAG